MQTAVPVIDIAELDSAAAHESIERACRDWGFFQVTNHGIDDRVIAALFDAAHRFFALPRDEKHRILRSAENPWGFYDRELTKNRQDRKEVFDYGPGEGDGQAARWPADPPGFRDAVLAYYRGCEQLAHRLLAVISSNLGMPADYLSRYFGDVHTSFVRLNYYPRYDTQITDSQEDTYGVGQHSDAGALTILLQDDQSGLEVCRDGHWYPVEPRAGALVINLGDMAQVWSNDRYVAALHRVVPPTMKDRYSAPFFFNPSWDTDYAPLPTTVSADAPARYRPINWREFRTLRHAGDYADYGDEVQISDYRV
jgi:isopenicillin N synthase-like dioxygenase